MERVTFLIERSGERVSCLLNPESLEARRQAGLVRRQQAGGALLGAVRGDDPLIPTGGGTTEYDLQLLFDVDVANEGRSQRPSAAPLQSLPEPEPLISGPDPEIEPVPADGDGAVALEEPGDSAADAVPAPTPAAEVTLPELADANPALVRDVRELTRPLWSLAETGVPVDGVLLAQRIRFIWGKSWNVPGVILAVAERLERFDADGVPRRSWLSMRLRRVEDDPEADSAAPPQLALDPQYNNGIEAGTGTDSLEAITVPVDPDGIASLRHDQIGSAFYGDPAMGRAVFEFNDQDDLLRIAEGLRLRLPAREAMLA